jgi:thioredoxin reductase (NADPH)
VAKPVILTVDDDPQVLAAVERDLQKYYRSDYRVVKAGSGREALGTVRQLKQRGTPVALFLVDQRMPEMSGTQLLAELLKLYPDARKVLLTAYADTDAAIESINSIGLDHYLMKPWDPPEERLYPILDDLLVEWRSHARVPFEGIRIAGARFSPASHAVREFLSRNLVPYQWIDIDQDASMRALVASLPGGPVKLPVVFFPDGSHLEAPTNAQVAQRAGLHTTPTNAFYDVIIVGGGPAGLACAVYAASEGLRTVLIEQNAPGGQAGTSSRIENYLGFPNGLTGADLAQRATSQARRFGAEIITAQEAVSISRKDPYRTIRLADGREISSYVVVLTTGQSVRMLEVPGITAYQGCGVYYGAALSEAVLYRDKDICVIGGANSAGQGGLFFSRYARKVTIVVRAAGLRPAMSHYLVERVEATPNIDVIARTEVAGMAGSGHLEEVSLRNVDTGGMRTLAAAGMFIFIGTAPRSDLVADFVERNEKGFIFTGPDLPKANGRPRGWALEREPLMFETSVPGVFAAGDVRANANRRVAMAVGEGSATIHSIHKYLETV